MSVLNFTDFAKRVTDFVGDNTSDEAMSFIADALDTIQDFQTRNSEDVEKLRTQLRETEDKWRKRYMSRFHSGIVGVPEEAKPQPETNPDDVTIDSLFTIKKG